jgi:Fungal specific transcription factor domain
MTPPATTNFNDTISIEQLFDFDAFALLEWDLPALSSPSLNLDLSSNHGLVFDEFDRSRLQYHLKDIPVEMNPPLPPPAQLTVMLRQYLEYISPISTVIHISSFNVRSCSIELLLLLLAVGDVYSIERTIERWARKAVAYLLKKKVEEFENSSEPLSLETVKALSMHVAELAYSGNPQKIALSTRYRICLVSACRDLLQQDANEIIDDEECWLLWIARETRCRTLINAYAIDSTISLHLNQPPMLRLSELRIPLPCSNEAWFAKSQSQWQDLHLLECHVRNSQSKMCCNQVLSALLRDAKLVMSHCREGTDLAAIAIAVSDLIAMTRRLMEAEGGEGIGSRYLMRKSREALDAWKSTWESTIHLTKAQYLALTSSWCNAELALSAPDFILKMVNELSMGNDVSVLVEKFLHEADKQAAALDAQHFNYVLNACAAALFHIETIAEFTSFDDCIYTLRASVSPIVLATIFLGGLCLWYSMRVIRIRGRSNPAAEGKVVSRFRKALSSISWGPQPLSCTDDAFIFLIGNLLEQTQVWGSQP